MPPPPLLVASPRGPQRRQRRLVLPFGVVEPLLLASDVPQRQVDIGELQGGRGDLVLRGFLWVAFRRRHRCRSSSSSGGAARPGAARLLALLLDHARQDRASRVEHLPGKVGVVAAGGSVAFVAFVAFAAFLFFLVFVGGRRLFDGPVFVVVSSSRFFVLGLRDGFSFALVVGSSDGSSTGSSSSFLRSGSSGGGFLLFLLLLRLRGRLLRSRPLVRGLLDTPTEDVNVGLRGAQQGLAVAEVGGGGLRGELWCYLSFLLWRSKEKTR